MSYCRSKPTCIWTNDHQLGELLVAIGGECKCRGNQKEGVRSAPGKNFAALPFELCKIISTYVHSKVMQLKLKKLIASRGGDKIGDESESSEDE
jgi:hypothetical protein